MVLTVGMIRAGDRGVGATLCHQELGQILYRIMGYRRADDAAPLPLLAHQPRGNKQFQMMGQRRPGDARAITQRADGQPVRACAHQQTENLQPLF